MNRNLFLVLILAAGGCTVGTRLETQPLAREPRGANVTLQTQNRAITGELLEVQDTALLVLREDERVVLVPLRLIRRGEAELRTPIVRGGQPPAAAARERLRRISRFPHGVSPALQRDLLRAYGQAELEVLQR